MKGFSQFKKTKAITLMIWQVSWLHIDLANA